MERQKEYVLSTVKERGIRFIRLWFTDVQGFLKSPGGVSSFYLILCIIYDTSKSYRDFSKKFLRG